MNFTPGLVSSRLDASVVAYGSRPCTYFMGRRLTYAEIGQLSDRAAKGLQALGVGEGVKVGLLLPNSPTFVIFYHAVLKAGGTVVNFNPLYSAEEIDFQAEDSGAKIMVTLDLAAIFDKVEPLLAKGRLDKAVVASFAALLPPLKAMGLKLRRGPKLAQIDKSPQRAKVVSERDLMANDGRYRKPGITPDTVAVLQYTGGTTGTPKGAMLTHANLSANLAQVTAWWNRPPGEGDRIVGVLPLFHVFAMTTVMNFGISQGMEIILLPRFELIETLKLITKLKPKMMHGVPTLFNAMLQHPHIKNFDLSSLEFCISGGAGLPVEVKRGFEAISGCTLREGYGLSETSPVAACNPHDRPPKAGSIGLPLPGTTISIRSLEDPAVEMPQGETGEICIAGPQVMPGYWNKPEETENAFVGTLLPHRRCRLHGRGGLHLHRRPHQGHDQLLGLQGLSAPDRGRPLRAPGGRGGDGDRHCRRLSRRGAQGLRQAEGRRRRDGGVSSTTSSEKSCRRSSFPPRSSSATNCRRPWSASTRNASCVPSVPAKSRSAANLDLL